MGQSSAVNFNTSGGTILGGYTGTDWQAYTPTFTGFGTPTSVSFYSRRVGDSLEVMGLFTTGTTTATTAQITLGYAGVNNNVTIDTTKITATTMVGKFAAAEAATTYFNASVLATGAVGYLEFGVQTSTTNEMTPANGSAINSTTTCSFFARVPISGWTSNATSGSNPPVTIPSSNAINWAQGQSFLQTLSANTTFTFSGAVAGQTVVVVLTNTASNYTVTWPTVRWQGGTAPTMTTGAFSDVYTFFYDGVHYYGSAVQNLS